MTTNNTGIEIEKMGNGKTLILVKQETGFLGYALDLNTTTHKYTFYGPLAFVHSEKDGGYHYEPKRDRKYPDRETFGRYYLPMRDYESVYHDYIFGLVRDHAPIHGEYTEGQGEKILDVIHTLGGIL